VHELVARALDLALALGQARVEILVGGLDRLLEQAVLGLEVVEDRRGAGSGPLGDVTDPRVEQSALVQDLGGRGDDLRLAQVVDFGTGTHLLRCSTFGDHRILTRRSGNYAVSSWLSRDKS
jgi:hypothetical protein